MLIFSESHGLSWFAVLPDYATYVQDDFGNLVRLPDADIYKPFAFASTTLDESEFAVREARRRIAKVESELAEARLALLDALPPGAAQ